MGRSVLLRNFTHLPQKSTHLPHPSPHVRTSAVASVSSPPPASGEHTQTVEHPCKGCSHAAAVELRREAHLPAIRSCVVAVKVRAVGAGSRVSEHPREACSLTEELMLPPTSGGGARGSSAHAQGGAHAPAHRRGQSSRLKGKFD